MSEKLLMKQRVRKNFGKIPKIVEIPDLIGVQRESYSRFLQMDVPPEEREEIGLQSVYKSVFPIKDFTGSASLEFVSYRFAEVKHSVEECIHRGMTYEIPCVSLRGWWCMMLIPKPVFPISGTSKSRKYTSAPFR